MNCYAKLFSKTADRLSNSLFAATSWSGYIALGKARDATPEKSAALVKSTLMEKRLKDFEGSRVEVTCGSGIVFCGLLREVNEDFVEIVDSDDLTVISADKIIAVRKSTDPTSRPGFII